MFDAAIIGTGPAGLSAALDLKLHDKSFIWFGSKKLSDRVARAEKIANLPALDMIGGRELNERFSAQIVSMGLEITEKKVTNIAPMGKSFMVLADNEIFEAKTVILAVGAVTAKGPEGEERLLGRGVSYCATCDGFLYRGKTVAVFCASKAFEHEAEYLAGLAEKVYLFTGYDCTLSLPNVELPGKPIVEVCGEERVSSVRLSDGRDIPVDGVFFLRESVKPSLLVAGIETDGAHIVVDRACRTNKPGLFACGDCTGRPYQLTKAMGEGNVAAHSALEYLAAEK